MKSMSINAQDLRIGNLVVYHSGENGDMICKLDAQDIYNISMKYAYSDEIHSPIPLTPEILEKAGFKHGMVEGISRLKSDIDETDEEGDTHYWSLKVPKNDLVEDLSTFEIVKFGSADYTWSHQWLRVKLTSVHQLQNIFFALTGQELTINL